MKYKIATEMARISTLFQVPIIQCDKTGLQIGHKWTSEKARDTYELLSELLMMCRKDELIAELKEANDDQT